MFKFLQFWGSWEAKQITKVLAYEMMEASLDPAGAEIMDFNRKQRWSLQGSGVSSVDFNSRKSEKSRFGCARGWSEEGKSGRRPPELVLLGRVAVPKTPEIKARNLN